MPVGLMNGAVGAWVGTPRVCVGAGLGQWQACSWGRQAVGAILQKTGTTTDDDSTGSTGHAEFDSIRVHASVSKRGKSGWNLHGLVGLQPPRYKGRSEWNPVTLTHFLDSVAVGPLHGLLGLHVPGCQGGPAHPDSSLVRGDFSAAGLMETRLLAPLGTGVPSGKRMT